MKPPISTLIAGLALLLLPSTLPGEVLAQAGTLDPTFGSGGIARIGFGDGTDESWALAQQGDGKYLVAGGAGPYLAVARYLYNGAPDLTFGEQGVARLWNVIGSTALGIVLQPDARIVVAGRVSNLALVARFLPDGSLDASFGVGGFGVIPDTLGFLASSIVMQGGQFLVAGAINSGTATSRFAVCRLTASGFLDPSFDGDGVQSTSIPNGGFANAITLQPDGKIVLAGYAKNAGIGYAACLVRYDANGALDLTFDGDGIVITTVGVSTNVTWAYAVIPQVISGSPVQLLVAGRTGSANPLGDGLLIRYNLNGSLDTVFGSGGVVVQSVSTGIDEFHAVRFVAGTTHANPSKIYVGGYTNTTTSNHDALLCSYTISGALNTNFGGGDGIVTTPIGAGQDEIWAMLLVGDRLIATGYANQGEERQNFMLARFLTSTGALDPTFDGDGIMQDDIADAESAATAVARQSDGKVILAGYNSGGYEQVLARLNPNGSPDSSFSGDGRVTFNFGTGIEYLTDVALQADQKIVVAGVAFLSNAHNMTISRYLPNGSLDPTFNGSGTLVTRQGSGDYDANIAIQPDGRILLAGWQQGPQVMRVSRYLSNGQADGTFGTGGHLALKAGGDRGFDGKMALQADGRIIIAGRRERFVNQTSIVEVVVLRLTTTGGLDSTFGAGGITIPVSPAGSRSITGVLVQPDGRIVVTGLEYITTGNRDPWALRLDSAGQLDPTFGTQGYRVISSSTVDEFVLAAALQADGRLLSTGRTGTEFLSDQLVARMETTGSPDLSFGGSGLLALDVGSGGGDVAYDILPGGPGPILVAGAANGLMCVSALQPGSSQSGVDEPIRPAHPALAVGQPWPSPTRAGVSLTLHTDDPAVVSAEVLDVSGRLVRTLGTAERLAAGEHRIAWDGDDAAGAPVAAGVYFVRVHAEDRVVSRRVVVVR